jgi:hypothetical protein
MRDSTYDQYRNEPPLDTVVKDLIFRIDPPDLLKVLQSRLDYIVRNTKPEDRTYVLDNGMNVEIDYSELIEYFKCILMAIRQNSLTLDIFYNFLIEIHVMEYKFLRIFVKVDISTLEIF